MRTGACFCMSLRGAKRRGNPFSLRQCKTRSNTLGEYGKVHTNLPEVVPSYQASLRGRGLPHQCAHWFAMTGLVGMCAPGHGCNVPHFCQGMRIAAPVPCNRRRVAVFSMSLRGAKRRGNPYSLRQCKTRSNTLGEYGKMHTNLPEVVPSYQASLRGRGLPQVCALVRNDRFGRYVRTRARVQCTTFLPGDADCRTSALQPQGRCRLQHVIARREATWQSVLLRQGMAKSSA